MKSYNQYIKQYISENITNVVGTQTDGNSKIAMPVEPINKNHLYRRLPVFEVDDETFNKFRYGKKRYARYSKYLNPKSKIDKKIHEYARKNYGKPIIIKNSNGDTKYIRFNRHGGGGNRKKRNPMIVDKSKINIPIFAEEFLPAGKSTPEGSAWSFFVICKPRDEKYFVSERLPHGPYYSYVTRNLAMNSLRLRERQYSNDNPNYKPRVCGARLFNKQVAGSVKVFYIGDESGNPSYDHSNGVLDIYPSNDRKFVDNALKYKEKNAKVYLGWVLIDGSV